jgi:hypothetical protein
LSELTDMKTVGLNCSIKPSIKPGS